MKAERWVWMPHPAHFICARDCQFHLATYVGGYVVSTVGELWPERSSRETHAEVYDPKWLTENRHLKGDNFDHAYMQKFGFETIGDERKYETMVFKARRATDKETCCPWRIDVSNEKDFEGYNTPDAAYAGHMRLCKKWSARRGGDAAAGPGTLRGWRVWQGRETE
jgi:hypothetical protein